MPPPAAPELTPLAAIFHFSSLAAFFAAAVAALRILAKYLLGFSPSWRRCFALSCAGIFAATAVIGLTSALIGGFTPSGGMVELLFGLLAAAAIYVRFLRPPADAPAPAPWKFFAVAVAQFAAWMIVMAAFNLAASFVAPPSL